MSGQRDLFDQESGAIRLSDRQRVDWLRLIRAENVGPRTFRDLINAYGGADRALEALPELSKRGGSARPTRIPTRNEIEDEIAQGTRIGVSFLAIGERGYPETLRACAAPPPILAIRGNIEAMMRPMVAIVGSRNASAAGITFARQLARGLGGNGFVVVSGLARGIDAAAHEASASSGTIAALAGGHDKIYPPENLPLLDKILPMGLAVSEMPMGWEPRARDFPRRNRIIAALSYGVIVIEAADRSGSLITARLASEEGREVFAVPGSPLDPRASGTNRLLKNGATMVTEVDDVIEALTPMIGHLPRRDQADEPESLFLGPGADPAPSDRQRIISLLGPTPVSLDDLARAAGLTIPVIRVVLLEMELAGRIIIHRGGKISLRPPESLFAG